MSNITAQMVKELRDRTGAGMMECKKALVEAGGDMNKAIDTMRKAGQAKADKKSLRVAAEGVIKLAVKDKKVANMLEVNCETDFVAKDKNFLEFAEAISIASLENFSTDISEFIQSKYSSKKTIEEERLELVSKIGENIKIRRVHSVNIENGFMGHYMHGSKICAVAVLENEDESLVKDICMHIAAMKPLAIDETGISQAVLDKEKEIFKAQAKESGKPENILEKMVEGKINKYISEVTLLNQKFVKDNEINIHTLLKNNNNKVISFFRMEVGEGIEKKDENFVDEVMAQIKN